MTALAVILILCGFIIWHGLVHIMEDERIRKIEERKKLQADLDRIHKRPMLRL